MLFIKKDPTEKMTQALYRKWRPHLWDEVVSQEHIIQTLKNAVASGRVGHAYLFSGPRGTGKTTAARLLAKAVNCLNPDLAKRPCNECANCVSVNENRFMDLIEIDAASNTSVDDVRDLRDKINFSPSQGTYRVYIIDEVHMLSISAFNALLKTLEEPPPHAIFILATTEIHKIPLTVLSRCQRHEFRRVPLGEIARHLSDICKTEKFEADADALTLIARQSSGGMRDAISLLDQLASTGGRITLELVQSVLGTATSQSVPALVQAVIDRHPAAGLNEIHHALDGGADSLVLARQIVEYLRNILLVQMGNSDQVEVSNDMRAMMAGHAASLSTAEVLRMMRAFNAAATELRGGWSPALGLELAFAEILEPPARVEPVQRAENVQKTESVSVSRPVPRPSVISQPEVKRAQPPAGVSAAALHPQETPPASGGTGVSVSLDRVVKAWKEVSNHVRDKEPNLTGLINSGRPIEIRDGVLILAFASEILQEKFNRPENLDLTRKAILQAVGVDLPIQTVVTGSNKALPAHVKPDGMVAAASQLGGEIVDIQ